MLSEATTLPPKPQPLPLKTKFLIPYSASCCDSLTLTYDHCLDCYYDGYDGVYAKQDQFYLNLHKNLVCIGIYWCSIV